MTEVEKFVKWCEDGIANYGLLGLSGVRFDRGQDPLEFLKQKAGSAMFFNGELTEPLTLEEIAKSFNDAEAAIARGEYTEMKFEDSTRGEKYVDDVLRKDATELFKAGDKGLKQQPLQTTLDVLKGVSGDTKRT